MKIFLVGLMLILVGGGFYAYNIYQELEYTEKIAIENLSRQIEQKRVVEIENFTFKPKELTVKPGTSVTFLNRDLVSHRIVGDSGTFETQTLRKAEAAKVQFREAGLFSYHSAAYPYVKGTIIVR